MSARFRTIVADPPWRPTLAFYDLVERVSPGPYLEMFSRRPRDGWAVWGNEVEITEGVLIGEEA